MRGVVTMSLCRMATTLFLGTGIALLPVRRAEGQDELRLRVEEVVRSVVKVEALQKGAPLVNWLEEWSYAYEAPLVGCASGWPEVSVWHVSHGGDGLPRTVGVVADSIYVLSGFAAPNLFGFVDALRKLRLQGGAANSVACLVDAVAGAMVRTNNEDVYASASTSAYQQGAHTRRLIANLPEGWPASGVLPFRDDTLAIFTVFVGSITSSKFVPVAYYLLFDSHHRLIGWISREGPLVVPH